MIGKRDLDELKLLGADKTASENIARLYTRAFRDFGAVALWSSQPAPNPTVADALAITRSLRV